LPPATWKRRRQREPQGRSGRVLQREARHPRALLGRRPIRSWSCYSEVCRPWGKGRR
jgi:hypothetical protein